MRNNGLIAGILLGGMMPLTPMPLRPDPRTGSFDVRASAKVGSIVTLSVRAYHALLTTLAAPNNSNSGEAIVNQLSNKNQSPDKTTPEQFNTVDDNVDLAVIAAIITAGMLPRLPVPKLRDAAKALDGAVSKDQIRPIAEVIADTLTLYQAVCHVLVTAEEKHHLQQHIRRDTSPLS
jgi:hypothetical protein